jgi:acetyl esterase/lipase
LVVTVMAVYRTLTLVYFQGGDWAIGDLETDDTLCRQLANGAGCAVVAVDTGWRRSTAFPPRSTAIGATEWVARNGAAVGVDVGRLAVGGDSAGGNLAAVVSFGRLQDRFDQSPIGRAGATASPSNEGPSSACSP